MFLKEGSQAPMPDPDKDCVLFMFIKEGKTVFAKSYPRPTWPRSDGSVEEELSAFPPKHSPRANVAHRGWRAGTGARAHFPPLARPGYLPPGSVAPLKN